MTSIVLINPKFVANLGACVRAAACLGADEVIYTGDRVSIDPETARIPRELRHKDYKDVAVINEQYVNHFFKGKVPVAVELVPGAEGLIEFEHPENAVYCFGPEDGSIPSHVLKHCHRFVQIPSRHCVNLSAAVHIILYDRYAKGAAHALAEVSV